MIIIRGLGRSKGPHLPGQADCYLRSGRQLQNNLPESIRMQKARGFKRLLDTVHDCLLHDMRHRPESSQLGGETECGSALRLGPGSQLGEAKIAPIFRGPLGGPPIVLQAPAALSLSCISSGASPQMPAIDLQVPIHSNTASLRLRCCALVPSFALP